MTLIFVFVILALLLGGGGVYFAHGRYGLPGQGNVLGLTVVVLVAPRLTGGLPPAQLWCSENLTTERRAYRRPWQFHLSPKEMVMRPILILIPLAALALAACGTTEKTVVVQPAPGATVVVPPSGDAHVVPNDN